MRVAPAELVSVRSRIGVLITFDLGDPRAGQDVIEVANLSPAPRDPRFFDDGAFRPIWEFGAEVDFTVPSASLVPASGLPDPIAGMRVRIRRYLHDFGFGCVFVTVDCAERADTDRLLVIAGRLASPDLAFASDAGTVVRLADLQSELIARTRTGFEGGASSSRIYSVIHLIELDPAVRGLVAPGQTIYERYEREFHALSVRVLTNWRDRYPDGVRFKEDNSSVAPSGVVRFNARNVVFYEYPYSSDDVESLYYPALVELRLWGLMVTRELAGLKSLVRRLEGSSATRKTVVAEVHESRRAALRIAAEFEALSQCTSKRTTRFYEAGMQEFGLYEMLRTLRDRTGQVEEVLSRQALADEIALERQLVNQQRDLALKAENAASQAAGVGLVLTGLSLVVGAQFALDIAGAFSWPGWARLLAIVAGVLLPVGTARAAQLAHARRRQVRLAWVGAVCLGQAPQALFEELMRQSHRDEVTEVRMDEDGEIFLIGHVASGQTWKGQVRIELRATTTVPHGQHQRYQVRFELDASASGRSKEKFVRPLAARLLTSLGVSLPVDTPQC